MSLQPPRRSVFTFQSAVHSGHLLQRLNEQRQRDVLCDVTVVAGHGSFRAHRSVLASCSEYFQSRITDATRLSPVITLPDEVTAEGFEALLQFAYTSKLLFTKENIQAIHSSADFLGFHNLESACFDFLVPKYSEGRSPVKEVRREACCQNGEPGASSGSGVESSPPRPLQSHSPAASGRGVQTESPSPCSPSTQGQSHSREEHFCLVNCGPQMAPLSLGLAANDVCPMLSFPDANKADDSSQYCEGDLLEIGGVCNQSHLSLAGCGLPCELSTPRGPSEPDLLQPAGREVNQTVETLGAETSCNPGSRPLNASEAEDCGELLEQNDGSLEQNMVADLSGPTLSALSQAEGFEERSREEREVAEHLAKGFWPDLCQSQAQPLPPLESMDQSTRAADFHWLKQLDLSSSAGDCPFLRDFGGSEDQVPLTDSLSQSEKSPYMSSSVNSGEDSDLDTDGDTEANKRRAAEIKLPFPVEQILVLSRSAFQQLLRHQQLTQEQLEFVHDVRRRSKNRVAAQRCRKRKLDSIQQLECEISVLRNEKERLLHERTQLEHNLEEARQSLCSVCKSVGVESGCAQDHNLILAKLSSPDFAASCTGKDQDSQMSVDMVSCSSGCNPGNSQTEGTSPAQSGLAQSGPVPASDLNDCQDITDGGEEPRTEPRA
ncbi:transcription regulator protein BACH1-like [Genypterus blacodes]|uniref:transcription regulator protein BACH1-like n=1 Tax=Genypterus blacodes TaxID=154954 RepID=UPI003F76DDC9